jgi:hypothetical protein
MTMMIMIIIYHYYLSNRVVFPWPAIEETVSHPVKACITPCEGMREDQKKTLCLPERDSWIFRTSGIRTMWLGRVDGGCLIYDALALPARPHPLPAPKHRTRLFYIIYNEPLKNRPYLSAM